MTPITHRVRHEQRREMAELIRRGKSLQYVVARYGTSVQTVRNACLENGVDIAAKKPPK